MKGSAFNTTLNYTNQTIELRLYPKNGELYIELVYKIILFDLAKKYPPFHINK